MTQDAHSGLSEQQKRNHANLKRSFFGVQRLAQSMLTDLHNHENPKIAESAAVASLAHDIQDMAETISQKAILAIGYVEFFDMHGADDRGPSLEAAS